MKSMLKLIFTGLLVSLLAGCQSRELSYDYLMLHPDVLKQQIEQCQSSPAKSSDESHRCEIVMSAGQRFVAILNEQENDPEAFGTKIMNAQLDATKAQLADESAHQALLKLQQDHASEADLVKANLAEQTAHKTFLEKRHDVAILLAVIGVNSPE